MTKETLNYANEVAERIKQLEKLLNEKEDADQFMQFMYQYEMYHESRIGKPAAKKLRDFMIKLYEELLFTTKQEFQRM